jgi:hypothetical protein
VDYPLFHYVLVLIVDHVKNRRCGLQLKDLQARGYAVLFRYNGGEGKETHL